MTHHLRRGLDIVIDGAPRQEVARGNPVESVAVHGGDYPGMRTALLVAVGDRVARGDPLFRDRKRPDITITAPAAGRVEAIETGPRRRISILRIRRDGDAARVFETDAAPGREATTALCLASGLWPAFVERPFGRIPSPGSTPQAIFVTAMDTDPLSADARVVVQPRHAMFQAGLVALAALTDGPVFVCQSPGPDLAEPTQQIRTEKFSGPHPAGLPGTHVDRLAPLGHGTTVWQVHYQDVIALGSVRLTGRLPETRIVALAGPGVRDPRLVEAPAGASLGDLVRGELREGPMRVVSGSPLSGRDSSHLRRRHTQVCVLRRTWPRPPPARRWATQAAALRPSPVVPTRALERALGPAIPVIPLIRALSVNDVEAADRLGCRALLEEDLALATYAAGGAEDFGALLRQVLNALERQP